MKVRGLVVVLAVFLLVACSSGTDGTSATDASDAVSHTPDSVDYAYMLCHASDSTNMQTEPCSVSTTNVDIHVALGAPGAQQLCAAIVKAAHEKGWVFESGWHVRIFSPYASNGPIATCAL